MTNSTTQLVHRYEVGELLGRGGMADVYLGVDTRLHRQVALKLLKPSLANDTTFRNRFRHEAQAAARMAHPTIVRVLDAGEDEMRQPDGRMLSVPFIVMEYVDGTLLRDMIARGPLDPDEAVRIENGILTALEYAHRAGIVHRDVKPGNVMIDREGNVKLTDFGIARAVSETTATVAQTTAILGTASYFSPEQARGEAMDARTDLYSAGVVLFEMLTGETPFRGESAVTVAYKHVSEPAPAPSSINPEVSPALDAVVQKALAKDRVDRYQSASEFRHDLDEAAKGVVPASVEQDEDDVTTSLFGVASTRKLDTQSEIARLQADDAPASRMQRRPPVTWIWAGIAVLTVCLIAVVIWVVNLPNQSALPSASSTVPNVVGKSYSNAEQLLTKADLRISRDDVYDQKVKKDTVMRTDPPADQQVSKKTIVTVTVSKGPAPLEIPDVDGKSVDDATKALQDAGFKIGDQRTVHDGPANQVSGSDPAAGTTVEFGSTVSLLVSDGQIDLPNVVGQPLDTATSSLQGMGLTVTPSPTTACLSSSGKSVRSQSVQPGIVAPGTNVVLTYCAGRPAPQPAPSSSNNGNNNGGGDNGGGDNGGGDNNGGDNNGGGDNGNG